MDLIQSGTFSDSTDANVGGAQCSIDASRFFCCCKQKQIMRTREREPTTLFCDTPRRTPTFTSHRSHQYDLQRYLNSYDDPSETEKEG